MIQAQFKNWASSSAGLNKEDFERFCEAAVGEAMPVELKFMTREEAYRREKHGRRDRLGSEAEGQLPVPCADGLVLGAGWAQSQAPCTLLCLKNWRCTIFRHDCPMARQIVRRDRVA